MGEDVVGCRVGVFDVGACEVGEVVVGDFVVGEVDGALLVGRKVGLKVGSDVGICSQRFRPVSAKLQTICPTA